MSLEAPAAAEPEPCDWLCVELEPPAAVDPREPDEEPCAPEEVEPVGGQEQFIAPAPPELVPPLAEPPALEDVLGVEAEAPPAALLDELAEPDGELPLLAGELPPVAAPLEPEALPEPEDWLVCAPWFIVEDGLVVVALWLALTPLETFWSPLPALMPGLTFAPAFTSLFEMPTLAPTPTFGFTLVPPEGALVDPPELWVVCDCWSVVLDDCAQAVPKAPITAAAVILTAKCRTLMSPPWWSTKS